jgi:Uma2 family endonuclease
VVGIAPRGASQPVDSDAGILRARSYAHKEPDWVCEVLSPSTEQMDRQRKLKIYAREGVSCVWLVNPISRTLEILRLEAGRWVLIDAHGGEEEIHAEPFDAVALELPRIWPTLAPAVPESDRGQ